MYQSLKFLPLKAGSLEAIGDAVVDASGGATDVVTNMFKKIIDNTVVPIALRILTLVILFLIFSISRAKKRMDGEGLEEKTITLFICIAVFVLIAGYGFIAGNLMDVILGKA